MKEKDKMRPTWFLTRKERDTVLAVDVQHSLDKEFGKQPEKKRYDPWRFYSC